MHLLDHIEAVNIAPDSAKLLAEIEDPILRETLKDFATMQKFRRDLFGRGSIALRPEEIPSYWQRTRFALIQPWPARPFTVSGAVGEVSPQMEVYEPILNSLAKGPKTGAELAQDPMVAPLGWPRLIEALKVLVGAGRAQPCLEAKGDGLRAKRTKVFNLAVLRRALTSGDLMALASPVTGGGVAVDRFEQLFILCGLEKHPDPPVLALERLAAQGQSLVKDGTVLTTADENLAELRARYDDFQTNYLPVLRQLGVL
jgi:hypothetical protein